MIRNTVPVLVAALLFAGGSSGLAQESGSDRGIISKLGSALTLYGFLRIDAVYDSDPMNDSQIATFVRSQDDPASGTSDFTLYTRLTRLGLDFDGGEVKGMKLDGKLELDFYGFDSSDSRNDLRIRHAYLNLKKDDLSLLAGQAWDLFSPLYPSINPDLVNWNAGNTGDRRPQLRVSYAPTVGDDSKLTLAGALAMQGAISPQEIDGTPDGVLDGEDSGIPQLQGRAAYGTKILTESTSELGAWFAYGQEKTDGPPIAGEDEWTSSIYGLDVTLPITDDLKLKGEFWAGENLNDLRGGIGQGINATTGDEIAAIGYWAQVDYALNDTTGIFVGTSVDDPDDGDLPTGGMDLNEQYYAGMTFRVWEPVRFGVDYVHWKTEYVGLRDGTNHRFRFWISYYF